MKSVNLYIREILAFNHDVQGVYMLSAKQAAEATGVSKQAIIKAITRGTISGTKDVHGAWTVDPAELFRHYEPLPVVHTNGDVLRTALRTNDDLVHTNGNVSDEDVHPRDTLSVDTLREKVLMLERIIDTKDDVINLLTNENNRLTAVVAQLAPPKAKVGWWQRLLGGV